MKVNVLPRGGGPFWFFVLSSSAAASVLRVQPHQHAQQLQFAPVLSSVSAIEDESVSGKETKPSSSFRGSVVDSFARLGASGEGSITKDYLDVRMQCKYMLGLLCILCCCGGLIREAMGDNAGGACITVSTLAVLFYVFYSGIYSAWWKGKDVGISCYIVCVWGFLNIVLLVVWCTCMVCGLGFIFGAAWIIKNASIKAMHKEYEKKRHELSGPRRQYYESEVFKQRCDALFDKYDADKSGTLDMSELEPIVIENLGEGAAQATPLLQAAFDNKRSSVVEKAEFVHMMQFLSMLKFQEGQFSEEAAWEVLQLNPDTATYDDVKRSYKKLSLQYHPDKRKGVPEAEMIRDMAEINDAKALLDKKFHQN